MNQKPPTDQDAEFADCYNCGQPTRLRENGNPVCSKCSKPPTESGEQLAALQKENNTLRGLLGNSAKDCVYCGLPAKDQAKCKSGFPGCARADDQSLSEHFAAGYDLMNAEKHIKEQEQELSALRQSHGELMEALNDCLVHDCKRSDAPARLQANKALATAQSLPTDNTMEELRRDKEILDWLEKEKPIVNRLSVRETEREYWHICWGDWAHTQHFGGAHTVNFTLRQSILAAIQSQNKPSV